MTSEGHDPIRALIAKWRTWLHEQRPPLSLFVSGTVRATEICADELEAALAAAPGVEPELQRLRERIKQSIADKPCVICGWPMHPEVEDWDLICPCCGYEPEHDKALTVPYRWDGDWWDKGHEPPIVKQLRARAEAAEARLAALSGETPQELEAVRKALDPNNLHKDLDLVGVAIMVRHDQQQAEELSCEIENEITRISTAIDWTISSVRFDSSAPHREFRTELKQLAQLAALESASPADAPGEGVPLPEQDADVQSAIVELKRGLESPFTYCSALLSKKECTAVLARLTAAGERPSTEEDKEKDDGLLGNTDMGKASGPPSTSKG